MPKFGTKNFLFSFFCARTLKVLLSYLKSAPSILSNSKILWRKKIAQICDKKCLISVFLTQNAVFGYFWSQLFEKLLSKLKPAPLILSNSKILSNNENAYIWDQKCLIWVFFGWNFKKLLSYLKATPWNLSKVSH